MDKQKQIEEIVKFHCNELYSNGICKEDNKTCVINNGNYCAVIENAKILLDKLIPENAVVLTRERYEWLTCCFGKFEEIMNDIKKSTRKETAEKFAVRLKVEYLPIVSSYFLEDDPNQFELENELCDLTDEICKEITEGKI